MIEKIKKEKEVLENKATFHYMFISFPRTISYIFKNWEKGHTLSISIDSAYAFEIYEHSELVLT